MCKAPNALSRPIIVLIQPYLAQLLTEMLAIGSDFFQIFPIISLAAKASFTIDRSPRFPPYTAMLKRLQENAFFAKSEVNIEERLKSE